jgi:hypothetical protein
VTEPDGEVPRPSGSTIFALVTAGMAWTLPVLGVVSLFALGGEGAQTNALGGLPCSLLAFAGVVAGVMSLAAGLTGLNHARERRPGAGTVAAAYVPLLVLAPLVVLIFGSIVSLIALSAAAALRP